LPADAPRQLLAKERVEQGTEERIDAPFELRKPQQAVMKRLEHRHGVTSCALGVPATDGERTYMRWIGRGSLRHVHSPSGGGFWQDAASDQRINAIPRILLLASSATLARRLASHDGVSENLPKAGEATYCVDSGAHDVAALPFLEMERSTNCPSRSIMEVMDMDTNGSKMKGASAREPLPAYSGTYLSMFYDEIIRLTEFARDRQVPNIVSAMRSPFSGRTTWK
jgi:hypothetical protein